MNRILILLLLPGIQSNIDVGTPLNMDLAPYRNALVFKKMIDYKENLFLFLVEKTYHFNWCCQTSSKNINRYCFIKKKILIYLFKNDGEKKSKIQKIQKNKYILDQLAMIHQNHTQPIKYNQTWLYVAILKN